MEHRDAHAEIAQAFDRRRILTGLRRRGGVRLITRPYPCTHGGRDEQSGNEGASSPDPGFHGLRGLACVERW